MAETVTHATHLGLAKTMLAAGEASRGLGIEPK